MKNHGRNSKHTRSTKQVEIAGKMPYHRLPERFEQIKGFARYLRRYIGRVRGFSNR